MNAVPMPFRPYCRKRELSLSKEMTSRNKIDVTESVASSNNRRPIPHKKNFLRQNYSPMQVSNKNILLEYSFSNKRSTSIHYMCPKQSQANLFTLVEK